MNNTESDFYLERVGFEFNVRLRINLKHGKNVVGRTDTADVDIHINSGQCSRRHCVITVTESTVFVEDLKSANGTYIRSKAINNKTKIAESDIIGIVGGNRPLEELVGNYNFFVYRLCKYSSTNVRTYELDDDDPILIEDDPIEIIDDADDNDVICFSDTDESIDSNEDHEVRIQISRTFNIELKQELQDIDDLEALCKDLKQEPIDYFEVDALTDDRINDEAIDYDKFRRHYNGNVQNGMIDTVPSIDLPILTAIDSSYLDTEQPCCSKYIGNFNTVTNGSLESKDSDDSNDTICFGSTSRIDNEEPTDQVPDVDEAIHQVHDINKPTDQVPDINKPTDQVPDINKPTDQVPDIIKPTDQVPDINKPTDQVPDINKPTDQVPDINAPTEIEQEDDSDIYAKIDKIKESLKLKIKEKEKRGPEIIDPKRLEGRKKAKPKVETNLPPAVISKSKAKNVVKKENRKESLKKISTKDAIESSANGQKRTITTAKVKLTRDNRGAFLIDPTQNPPTPSLIKKRRLSADFPVAPSEAAPVISTIQKLSPLEPQNSNDNIGSVDYEALDAALETITENIQNEEEEEARILAEEPECGTVNVIETEPHPKNLKSILKKIGSSRKHPKLLVTFEGSSFQVDPCHEIISTVTLYEPGELKTSNGESRKNSVGLREFANTYEDCLAYQSTLVPLMKNELWKEIQIEFTNSAMHYTTSFKVTYQNIEKRGDGKRLVLHCQGENTVKKTLLSDGHLVLASCKEDVVNVEFLAFITEIKYTNGKDNLQTVFFTLETAKINKKLKTDALQIRPITVITNTLNTFRAVYSLEKSPLLKLILNPLMLQIEPLKENVKYKGYDILDENQSQILKAIYKKCIEPHRRSAFLPNISLVDGAAGTGKSCLIANLALQLTYGDELPRPLQILVCSKSNRNIDQIALRLIKVRNRMEENKRIKLVRFGLLESMQSAVRCVSTQSFKENETKFLEYAKLDNLKKEKNNIILKKLALTHDERDRSAEIRSLDSKLVVVTTLIERLEGLDEKKRSDANTVILNSCEVICTTLGSIPKLKQYINKIDVCIISEATQCNEALTLLPFQFGMPSLVLVGDSQQQPPTPFSKVVNELKYGKSLFERFQKLFLGQMRSPVFELNFQYRMHPAILHWPNAAFYKSRLISHTSSIDDSFPLMPFKVISYRPEVPDIPYVMILIDVILKNVDLDKYKIGVISSNPKQNLIIQKKLRDLPFVSTNTAESYLAEMDVTIIWISGDSGLSHFINKQILNMAVTRPRKCLIILGANLRNYKNRFLWRSLLENAQERNCLHQINLDDAAPTLTNILCKKNLNNTFRGI